MSNAQVTTSPYNLPAVRAATSLHGGRAQRTGVCELGARGEHGPNGLGLLWGLALPALLALLVLAACASDPDTQAGHVVPSPDDASAFLWDQTKVRTFDLNISPERLAEIDADPVAEVYVPAAFAFGSERYDDIEVRYKGSFGAFRRCTEASPGTAGGKKSCPKLSMKIKFNGNNPKGRFHGLRKLQFHSMNNDSSMMRDRLGYWLFRQMGIAAPRAVHARLRINGAFAGLFILVEQIDGSFTRSRFKDGGEGNLYKEIWPKWTDADVYTPALRTNEDDPELSHDRVVRFASALQGAETDQEVAALAAQWMDMPYTMAFIAVDRAIRHDDGMFHWYCGIELGHNPSGCSNHNYYWYMARHSDRMWLVPWDLDVSLRRPTGFVALTTPWNDLTVACGSNRGGQEPASCDALTRGWAQHGQLYRQALDQLVRGPFSEAQVERQLAQWEAQIAPSVEEAARSQLGPDVASWQQARQTLRDIIGELRAAASLQAMGPTNTAP